MGEIDISQTMLLSAADICDRLSVSRSTFDSWCKINPDAQSPCSTGGFQDRVVEMRTPSDVENETLGLTPFPGPAMKVGGSPRWDVNDVNIWLKENKDKRSRSGFQT